MVDAASSGERRLRAAHRALGLGVLLFALPHLVNHVAGPAVHLCVMHALRTVYGSTPGHVLLLVLVGAQVCLGLSLAWRTRHARRDLASKAQLWSGLYVAFFVLQHVLSVLYTRAVLHLDTNIFWAASVVRAMPERMYYLPYYALAPLALWTHIGMALRYALGARSERLAAHVGTACVVLGGSISLIVLAALLGLVTPFDLPQAYLLQ
jgi:hypothetical protein